MTSKPEPAPERADAKRKALLIIKRQAARIRELEAAGSAPIAVVGYGLRFPGGPDAEAFWHLLESGLDPIAEVPADRWNIDAYFDPDPDAPGKMVTRVGGFLSEIDCFDAGLFGISPREAASMDPQHRLLLEVTWEALERAGQAPQGLRGSRTGVFVGIASSDYAQLVAGRGEAAIDAYAGTGTAHSAGVGRISYVLGLEGPNVAIDTACSSALVAVHQACQSLRSGKSDLALAGGVNVILTPEPTLNFSKARMLAPDGRCKTFDATADGYVRSEGCGIVVLKRLKDARRDGDTVLALLRGSAVNQDGASAGLTVPSAAAQERVIRDALAQARVAPREVVYLEAHGTGTRLGDPIEVQAAAAVLGEGREPGEPLLLGSVKTHVGHLEAAAGAAALIKIVQAIEHGKIPGHLHFRQPSPHIPWQRLPVAVRTECGPWPSGRRRIAGVSSFGFSGTNAHVVVEEPPAPEGTVATVAPTAPEAVVAAAVPAPQVLAISGRDGEALARLAGRYEDWLERHPEAVLADVAYTAGAGRSHLGERGAVVAATTAEARDLLGKLRRGETAPGLFRGGRSARPKVAWLFSGQGSQYRGMGRELYVAQPVFREVFDRCDRQVSAASGTSLLDVVFATERAVESAAESADGRPALLDQTRFTQPALFALEVALAELWRSWGLTPDIVFGHSVGEFAAAVVAGAVTLEDGLSLVLRRAELMADLPAGGAMAAVFAGLREVRGRLAHEPRLAVAADNGSHVVLSGPAEALDALLADFSRDGVRTRRLRTSHAFHSALVEPILDDFEAFAARCELRPPRRTLIASLTGRPLSPGRTLDAPYWRRQARETVQFGPAVQSLAELGVGLLLEVGPQPVLLGMAGRSWPKPGPEAASEVTPSPRLVPSLRRGRGEMRQLAEALAELYAAGLTPDFAAWDPAAADRQPRRKLALPTYPFRRSRFWLEAPSRPPSATPATPPAGRGPAATAVERCLFEVGWRRRELPAETAPPGEPGTWLLLADELGWARSLAARLAERGCPCRLLRAEEIEGQGAAGFARVLGELATAEPPLRRVVHLWSLDLPSAAGEAALGAFASLALLSTLHLVQALVQSSVAVPLTLVTRGAQAVADEETVEPFQAPLWGLGKVLALEHPELWGGLVDLPVAAAPGADAPWSERLLSALSSSPPAADTGEDQVALRETGSFLPRLRPLALGKAGTPLQISLKASYLVTGGLGALGLQVARWLAAEGARHLALVGRRPPGVAALGAIEEIEALGCRVEVLAADVSRREEVEGLLLEIGRRMPPLQGLVHAAGVVAERPLREMLDEELAEMLAAKVSGAWWLHELTRELGLAAFVTFSSVSAVWGSLGHGHYAAANAFLDALARFRRGQGLAATSLAYGPWAAEGMAVTEGGERLRLSGLQLLDPATALAAWPRVAGCDRAQAVVAAADWPTFLAVYQARQRRPFLEELATSLASSRPPSLPDSTAPTALVERLAAAPPGERRRLLEDRLRAIVGEVLRLDPAEIDPRVGFFDLGMDSLMAVELRRHLEAALGCSLPATLAMDRPRLGELADFLLGEVLALGALGVRRSTATGTASPREPIAIIALACRTPGAGSAEELWELLSEGREAIAEPPPERWDVEAYYDPDPETPGKIYTRYGGFLDRLDRFDAAFFGIAPREAVGMDPQQRLLLEVGWEALERAGVAPHSLAGTRTGVFVGVGGNEYGRLLAAGGAEAIDAHFITGNAVNAIAGRVAFVFGLEGPAMAVDTACSSSLVALHQACQALRSGDCDLVLAGGVNVLLTPEGMIAACRARMLAPDGRCKTFDATADGYVRGEGCGVVVLKRLSDALRDGDPLLGVVRGSAVNQDGASSGLTVPNGPSQERVIRAALHQSGCEPAEVDYLEAHGTGTPLGDPIEVQAAAAVFGELREAARPLLLGSVKTNLGHLESASGMASLAKVLLAFEHGVIPAHLHFHEPNPHIAWQSLPVEVVSRARPWPEGRRIAGISSFGFTGTNAHVIVEGPPVAAPRGEGGAERSHHLWVLSARSEPALRELAARYLGRLEGPGEVDLGDFGYTSGVGRSHLEERAALVVGTVAEARELLARLGAGEPAPGLYRGRVKGRPRVAWFFGGIDSAGMGGELYSTQPVFRAAVDRCGGLAVLLGRDEDESGFALAMGLAELWRSWGVEPDVVFGEGAGERAAEAVAGMLSVGKSLLDPGRGLKQLGELGMGVLMEMGSRPALLGLTGSEPPLRVASLLPGRGETFQLATGMARLYAAGVTPSFAGWDRPWPRRKVALPTYPFERQRYWVEPSATRSTSEIRGVHPFLGIRQESAVSGEVVYTSTLAGGSPGYLADHVIYERMVMPASGFAALVLGSGPLPRRLLGMSILEPLLLSALGSRELQLSLERSPDGASSSFQLHSRAEGVEEEWTLHCRGRVEPGPEAGVEPRASESLDCLRSRLDARESQELYERSTALGLALGPTFRGIRRLWSRGGEALAEIVVPSGLGGLDASLPIHPAVLDACTQASAVTLEDLSGSDLYLPIEYQDLVLYRPVPTQFYCSVRQRVGFGEESRTFDLELFDAAEGLLGALRGFVLKRAPRQALLRGVEREVGGLLYGVEWREALREEAVPRASFAGHWWVVAEKDLGAGLARELALQGRTATGEWEGPLAGVVVLAERAVEGSEDPLGAARSMCEGPLDLVQALLGREVDLPGGLWLVTRGGVGMAGDSGLDPWSALLWGFGRVVASEQPGLGCRLLDVDPAMPWPLADLARRLVQETGEAQEVWRGKSRYVPRLVPLRLPGSSGLEVRPEATYVVTGGLGSLGRRAARWLARRGARHLVLVGRQPSGEVAAEVVTELASLGCQARVVAADVSRSEDVSSLLAEIASMGMPLRGVVHAAGVLDDGMVGSQSWDRFAGVLSPKLAGAWHLHAQTAGLPLDFFVLYSSIAPLLGVPGQSSYAAANAYLDALAWERRRQGLAATSVNWGPWSAGGMVSERSLETRLRSRGLGLLETEEAHAALERLVVGGVAQGAVLRADWRRYGDQSSVPPSLLQELCAPGAGGSDLLARLTALSPEGRRGAMAEHLKREVQAVLALPGPPDPEEGFFNLGMDSMLSVELVNRLQAQLGTSYRLASTVAFDYPTVTSLAGHLSERLLGLAAKPALAREPRRGSLDEPVAIVGLGCRLPGAPDVESYWRLLRDGVDAIREVPAERWDIESFYDPDPEAPGKMTTRFGGFLEGIDRFDPQFFSISPREAVTLDPQQRLLLEVTWEALENAGIPPQRLFGTRTGVYMGMATTDYGRLISSQGVEAIDQYLGTGNALSAAVGRLSFVYGLQGPCMAVDTACSASLVALNQACRALLSGDCEVALAGGVNAILSPDLTVYFSKARMMAPDGRCKAFDAAADGYVRGEGCGIVVLKRQSDAERDGDRIWGLIRGSAVNQDGRSSGLTVPNGPSQERVIREALAQGGVEPEAVSYVEAHGTGTALGDPIEIRSLEAVFGAGRARRSPLLVGSVKTNMGHLETAAGIAGLIKVVLSMEGDLIPAHLHFRQPSPRMAWEEISVRVSSEATPWPAGRKVAGVSSFAFSGTNAHVVVEEAPPSRRWESAGGARGAHLLVLSARQPEALLALAGRYRSWLLSHPEADLGDVAYTAGVGRNHLEERAGLVASTALEAVELLGCLERGESAVGLFRGSSRSQPKVAWLFPGEGSGYVGMGRELYSSQPVFREVVERCSRLLGVESLLDDEARSAGPALLAVELGLAALWRSFGQEPEVVAGQGVGEITAAVVAGVTPFEEGVLAGVAGRPEVERMSVWSQTGEALGSGVETLARLGVGLLLEVGPHPVLSMRVAASWPEAVPAPILAASLCRDAEEDGQLAAAAAILHVHGRTLDFAAWDHPWPRRRERLPTYPFQRQRYWLEPGRPGRPVGSGPSHPLLGTRQDLASGEEVYTQEVSCRRQPWLSDHRVFGTVVVPAASHLAMVLASVHGPCRLSQGLIQRALQLDDPESARELQLVLKPEAEGGGAFQIFSRPLDGSGGAWMLHIEGRREALAPQASPDPGGSTLAELRGRLSEEPMDYAVFAAAGIELGPRFQGVGRLWRGPGEALGEIRVPPGLERGDFPIHPAVLDACLQLAGPAGSGLREPGAYVPFAWQEIEIDGPVPALFYCHVRLREGGREAETLTADLRLLGEDGRLRGRIDGYVARRASRRTLLAARPDALAEWMYEVVWRDLEERDAPADFWPAPGDLATTLLATAEALAEEEGVGPRTRALADGLERLAQEYAWRALDLLGWASVAGGELTAGELASRLGIAPAHRKLLGRLLAILGEAGWLAPAAARADGWKVARAPEPVDPERRRAELAASYPEARVELALLGRCGADLASVLTGRSDPLALLFPPDGPGVEDLYREAAGPRLFNRLAGETVTAALRDLPAGRRLRVLEVGAGTGATTAAILPLLPAGRVDYLYTDVSAGFFDAARQRFAGYGFVRYRTFDLERPPSEQGETGPFDLVLAANVLHATRDLGAALEHVRRLLAPGGLLLLVEGLRPQGWLDLTFGLLEGWWRFADGLRTDYPLLSAAGWSRAFEASGYWEPVAIAPAGVDSQAILVARAAPEWRPPAEPAGSWLIAADRTSVGAALAERLARRGQRCILVEPLVEPGKGYARTGEDRYRLPGEDARDWERLLAEAFAGAPPLRGVVHLWSLDAAPTAETLTESADTLSSDVRHGCGSLLALAVALARRDALAQGGLWVVTRGAQVTAKEACDSLAQAPIWGLAKVLALEHPELACRRVDFEAVGLGDPAEDSSGALDALTAELLRPEGEDQLARRGGRWRVPRLVRCELGEPAPPAFSPEGTFLLTGGLGGLGLAVARWLASQGARHLLLAGRRPPGPKAEAALDDLRRLGANTAGTIDIEVITGDVSQESDVRRWLERATRDSRPLAGVFHLAGVLRDGALLNQTWQRFEEVLAAKVQGAWHLHRLTAGRPLDHFVLFSSTAALLGNRGQANHAAANTFLDLLARHRRASGLPALSINWGAWSGIGAAVRAESRVSDLGLDWIAPEQGLLALGRALASGRSQVGVLPIDWRRFADRLGGRGVPPFLAEVLTAPSASPGTPARSGLRRRLERAPEEARLSLLMEYLGQEVMRVLGLPSPVAPDAGLFDLGMDSLMVVELRNRINQELRLGSALSPTALFDHPSVRALAAHLVERLDDRPSTPELAAPEAPDGIPAARFAAPSVPEAVPQASAASESDGLDELSADQLSDLLSRQLAAILSPDDLQP